MSLTSILLTEKVKRSDRPNAYKTSEEILYDYYIQNKDAVNADPSKEIYVHFTDSDKVGINPQTEHNTPYGFYGYPLVAMVDDYLKTGSSYGVVVRDEKRIPHTLFPYRSRSKNIFVYRLKPNAKVLFMDDTVDEKVVASIASEILKIDDDFKYGEQRIGQSLENYMLSAMESSEWKAWKLLRLVSRMSDFELRKKSSKWFIKAGIDGFSDIKGSGTIYPSEPFQMVTFRMGAIEVIDKLKNNVGSETEAEKLEKRDIYSEQKEYALGIIKKFKRSELQGRPFRVAIFPSLTKPTLDLYRRNGYKEMIFAEANYVYPILWEEPYEIYNDTLNGNAFFLQGLVVHPWLNYFDKMDTTVEYLLKVKYGFLPKGMEIPTFGGKTSTVPSDNAFQLVFTDHKLTTQDGSGYPYTTEDLIESVTSLAKKNTRIKIGVAYDGKIEEV